ncbi:MAG: hypothetical protein R3B91_17895 [Planctomycetaceae bacterium]
MTKACHLACADNGVSALAIVMTVLVGCRTAHEVADITLPEQRQIAYRSPASLPATPLPTYSPPRTVTNPDNGQEDLHLSLDEAIHIALANAEVIRVLGGFTATSTGAPSTIRALPTRRSIRPAVSSIPRFPSTIRSRKTSSPTASSPRARREQDRRDADRNLQPGRHAFG